MLTTTYTVTIERGDIWEFKYNLNEFLISYQCLKGDIEQVHSDWMFKKGKFPYLESIITTDWQKKFKQLKIVKGEMDLSFELFFKKVYPYNPLSKKKTAIERWNKLSKQDHIKLFQNTPEYIKLKHQEGTAFPYLEVYIRGRWWDK